MKKTPPKSKQPVSVSLDRKTPDPGLGERGTAPEALLQSEQRFRTLIEKSTDIIALITADGTIIYQSPSMEPALGYRPGELVGQNIFSYLESLDLARAREALDQILGRPGISVSKLLRFRHKDGSSRWLEGTGTNLLNDVTVGAIALNYRDVTARIHAETARHESEQKFRNMMHGLQAAIYTCDTRGRLTHYNEAAATLWGSAPKLGQDQWCNSWRASTPDGEPVRFDTFPLTGAPHQGRSIRGQEIVIDRPDGTRRFALQYPDLILDSSGTVVGAINMLVDLTRQKHAEAHLRQSEQWLKAIFDQAAVGVAQTDATQGRIMRVNQRFCDIVGYTRKEVEQLTVAQITYPPDVGPDMDLKSQLREGAIRNYVREKRYVRKDGSIVWISLAVSVLRPPGEAPVSFVGFVQDITERKQAELALQASEARYRSILQGVETGVIVLDANMRITAFNAKATELYGVTDAQLSTRIPGDPLFRRVRLDGTPLSEAELPSSRAFSSRQPVRDVILGVARPVSGDFLWLLFNANPVLTAQGDVAEVIVSFMDVTARVRAEQAVRDNATFTEDILNSLTAHVVVLDEESTIIAVNEAWRRFARENGITATDFIGYDYFAACLVAGQEYGAGAPEVATGIREVLAGLRLDFEFEYSCHALAQVRWFLIRVSPLSGARRGVVVAHQNITEHKQLEEQLRQSQKMEAIGQLSGGVAHDFNNLLTVIKGHIGILRMKGQVSPGMIDSVQQIDEAADRAAKLTRQLLMFSRRDVMQHKPQNLNGLTTNLARMLRRLVSENIDMVVECTEQPLPIRADEGMVEQVLLNFVVNARDAMPNGGTLRVTTVAVDLDKAAAQQMARARPGAFVCLAVSDTGTGIPPELLSRIFEPFFTTKGIGKGTGLGLATVYSVMQQHDGWVNVESEVGRGSTFRAYFPRAVADLSAIRLDQIGEPVRGGQETILLVEDDSAVREVAVEALTRFGYRVIAAINGREALQLWEIHKHEINLLVADLVMPEGVTGRALALRVRQDNPKLPVVYMSGYSNEVAGGDFMLLEGANYLPKPYDASSLAKLVRASLDRGVSTAPFTGSAGEPSPG